MIVDSGMEGGVQDSSISSSSSRSRFADAGGLPLPPGAAQRAPGGRTGPHFA